MFIDTLRTELSSKSLLEHKFYQLWNSGKLSKSAMSDYAKQYYCFVNNFPRFIALVYSKCENSISRRILLENLIIEGNGRNNKAKTWSQFAIHLGLIEYDIEHAVPSKTTEFAINQYWNLCNESYQSGLGALFTYEFYIPSLALMQMKALKKYYDIRNKDALRFFNSYQDIDMWDSDKISTLIVKTFKKDHIIIYDAAIAAHQAIWTFLDGLVISNNLE